MNGHSAYAQLLAVGLPWIFFHCAGMCGPLLCGLDVGGAARGGSVGRGVSSLLLYQGGRALTYAFLGGLAGLFGAGIERTLSGTGSALAVVAGLALLADAARRIAPRRPVLVGIGMRPATPTLLERALATARPAVVALSSSDHPLRPAALGALLGFLPCMIAVWALSLAATTASPLHGALVMWLLVAMTTPVLLVATLAPRASRMLPARMRALAPPVLRAVSGLWLVLVGLAGAGVVAHAHASFSLFGRGFVLMFY